MKSRVSEGPGVKSLTYPKVKPNVTFCLCWRSSGAEQLPCKQWVGGSNPPASASFFDELPGAAGGFGEVPKWPKGADCKSAGVRLRGFKSSPPHHRSGCLEAGFDRGWAEKDATARGTRGSKYSISQLRWRILRRRPQRLEAITGEPSHVTVL